MCVRYYLKRVQPRKTHCALKFVKKSVIWGSKQEIIFLDLLALERNSKKNFKLTYTFFLLHFFLLL